MSTAALGRCALHALLPALTIASISGPGCVRVTACTPRASCPDPQADASADLPLTDSRKPEREQSDDGPPPDVSRDLTSDGPSGDGSGVDGLRPLDVLRPTDAGLDQPTADAGRVPGVWIAVPPTTFTMGSPPGEGCRGSDEAERRVSLTRRFKIQSTEVTQAAFLLALGYNPSMSRCSPSAQCPVDSVTWHEAAAYCNALSKIAGKAPCYRCTGSGSNMACQEAAAYTQQNIYRCPGYRLPTEAEWERAYRAGTTTSYYLGANDPALCSSCTPVDALADAIAWYCGNAGGKSHPVAKKTPNGLGLYDMAGNVAEWCHDRYQRSAGAGLLVDPWGAPTGNTHVLRGGSWTSTPGTIRAAERTYFPATRRYRVHGFRCATTQ